MTETPQKKSSARFVGLMSGTSLDGVDGVLVDFSEPAKPALKAHVHLPFHTHLKQQLLALNAPGNNEIEHAELAANQLAELYASSVIALLNQTNLQASDIRAIGCHGQTIRHRPELGYTVQIGNAALLAELTGIDVVADFRSRDIAAGGQGAPLVPAFHQDVFGNAATHRVIVNIGGISNLTNLPPDGAISGFDCGPGNLLMDGWIMQHRGEAFDKDGTWAAGGRVIDALLQRLMRDEFFSLAPPKSTGRDKFHMAWLQSHLPPAWLPADVQATLLEFSASCIINDIKKYCSGAKEVYLCGGGARNSRLVERLRSLHPDVSIAPTDTLGIAVDLVESTAFAWLARQCVSRQPGNLPTVTGARGPRVLGAIYQA